MGLGFLRSSDEWTVTLKPSLEAEPTAPARLGLQSGPIEFPPAPCFKNLHPGFGWGSVVEHLFSMCALLSSMASPGG